MQISSIRAVIEIKPCRCGSFPAQPEAGGSAERNIRKIRDYGAEMLTQINNH